MVTSYVTAQQVFFASTEGLPANELRLAQQTLATHPKFQID